MELPCFASSLAPMVRGLYYTHCRLLGALGAQQARQHDHGQSSGKMSSGVIEAPRNTAGQLEYGGVGDNRQGHALTLLKFI